MFSLEFSFDRAKNSQFNNTQSRPNSGAQPNSGFGASGVRSGPDINSQDPSTIANERLRKAIERNRAKQAEREAQRSAQPQSSRPQFTPPPRPENIRPEGAEYEQASFFSQAAQETMSSSRSYKANRSAQSEDFANHSSGATEQPRATRTAAPKAATVVSRRSVAKPESTEFVPAKRATRKVSSHVSYTTSSTRKKAKSLNPKYVDYLVKGCWIFCSVMVLRLIFANGGVTDYYSQKNMVKVRQNELAGIQKENSQLEKEIERMKSDVGYQKKLVRDNLGFIAKDEFLVLFPKER